MKISNVGKNIKSVVEVNINGFFVERLINLLKQNGIDIWDIKYLNVGEVKFKISSKDFKNIKPYIKKSKCKIKIISKRGIYFEMFRYRKRRAVIYLTCAFLIIYLLFSNFIWKINIVGNDRIGKDVIMSLLSECKVKIGTYKGKISKGKVSDYIRAKLYDAAWIGIEIKGTTIEITVEDNI